RRRPRSTSVLRMAHDFAGAGNATLLELRDLPLDGLLFGRASDALARAHVLIAEARAIVLATPVYKAAYSGLLKTFLDYLPDDALRGKSAYPIATGGSNAHMLSIDYALKPILSVLGTSRILEGLYLTNEAIQLDAGGTASLSPENSERLKAGMQALLR
ncbi:MAG: NAD(P)H-dependent oxidoreductase, partial [Vulcanimicrobiaceae bacterium]